MTTLTGSVGAARHQRAEGRRHKLGSTAAEPRREATKGGLLQNC